MTFVITEPCIDTMDQSCVDVCPVDCIHFEEGKDRMLYIDPAECIDCGACQPACPVSAIFPEGDVPANQQHFTEINSLWFQDADAARGKVGGGGGAAAPATEEAETPAAAEVAQEEPAGEAQSVAEADPAEAQPETAPATAETREAQVAASTAPAAEPEYQEAVRQVPATSAYAAPAVSTYRLPPAGGFITLAIFAFMFVLIWTVPGPPVLEIGGVEVGATVLVLTPLALLFALLFVVTQARDMSLFSAHHDDPADHWRERSFAWRRNEESRQHYLGETVRTIAAERFAFPNEENPDLRTFVNLPEPQFGIEPIGSGEKLFPDIVTVEYPGYYAVAIGQVETRETVTREQATYVWARLENRQCPLYLYVPAGMLKTARKYARAAGLKNVRFRTWRWTPNGMLVRES